MDGRRLHGDPVSHTELALVGTGTWGSNYLRTIAGMDDVSVVAAASRNDWTHLVSSEVVGAIIATPPDSHREIATAFIDSGKAVLVEKPLTLSVEDAVALEAAAAERDVLVMVNHIYLFHPAWPYVRDWVEGRNVSRILTTGGNRGPFRSDCPPLWDYAPHDLAMCMDILGPVIGASATKVASEVSDDGAQLWAIDLTFTEDRVARCVVGNGMAVRTRRVEISTADESLTFDDTATDILIHRDDAGSRLVPVDTESTPLANVVRTFASAIASGSTDRSSLHDAVEIVRILEDLEG